MSFKWFSIVIDAGVQNLLRLLFVDNLTSNFILDSDHFLRQYVFVTKVWILNVWPCSLVNYNLSVVLWWRILLLDALLVRITSDWWNIRNSTLIYKRSLVVNWRLLLSTRSLHHLWIFCGIWRICVWILKFTLFLVSSIASCFGEVPALNEF